MGGVQRRVYESHRTADNGLSGPELHGSGVQAGTGDRLTEDNYDGSVQGHVALARRWLGPHDNGRPSGRNGQSQWLPNNSAALIGHNDLDRVANVGVDQYRVEAAVENRSGQEVGAADAVDCGSAAA